MQVYRRHIVRSNRVNVLAAILLLHCVVSSPQPTNETQPFSSHHPTASVAGYEKTDFLKEIDMMKMVAEGNNTHVVSFVGCVTVQEPLCLVTEYVRHGDLLAYLQNIRRMVK